MVLLTTFDPLAPPAEAHAFLVRTTPQAGERLETSPTSIGLQFSEPVAASQQITITTAGGLQVETGRIERVGNGSALRVEISALPNDVFVVAWQVLAADGHVSVGEFAFAVGVTGQIPAATQDGDVTLWTMAAAGWLTVAGVLIAFGALASERIVWGPVEARHRVAIPRMPVWLLLTIALGGAGMRLLLLAQQTTGDGQPWTRLFSTRPGLLAVLEITFIAYALWILRLRSIRVWAILPTGLALAILAVRGHTGASSYWWAAPANVVHLVAVSLWIGGLSYLALVAWRFREDERRPALRDGARQYAALALWLVAIVLVSGAITTLSQLTQLADLLTTRYGQFLLVKLAFVVAALGLAYAARRYSLPRSAGIQPNLLRRLTRAEGMSIAVAVGLAVILANTAPPPRASATQNLLGPPPLEGPVVRLATFAGSLAVYLAAGEDMLQVQVLPPSPEDSPSIAVAITGRSPVGTEIDVTPRVCGPGCVTTPFPWAAGVTDLTISASADSLAGGSVSFTVPWPPQPENPALLDRVIETMRSQESLTLTERVSSGPGASAENTYSMSGAQFMDLELYTAGGASDVRPLPDTGDLRGLTLYLPGSSMWYYLEIDQQDRLQREVIVNRGHLIERTFMYGRSS